MEMLIESSNIHTGLARGVLKGGAVPQSQKRPSKPNNRSYLFVHISRCVSVLVKHIYIPYTYNIISLFPTPFPQPPHTPPVTIAPNCHYVFLSRSKLLEVDPIANNLLHRFLISPASPNSATRPPRKRRSGMAKVFILSRQNCWFWKTRSWVPGHLLGASGHVFRGAFNVSWGALTHL